MSILIQKTDIFETLYSPPELQLEDSVSTSPLYAFRNLTDTTH